MGDTDNPWLSRPAQVEATSVAAQMTAVAPPTGPTLPQHGVPTPDLVDQLPLRSQGHVAELWWLGAHGGAGESSLAALVPGWPAAEHAWPVTPSPLPARVVVAVRSHAHGLRAAQAAVTQWASGMVPQCELLGLVVVADAPGRLPRPLRQLAEIVGGGYPRMWHVPWSEAWRLGEVPDLTGAPRDIVRMVADLKALNNPGA